MKKSAEYKTPALSVLQPDTKCTALATGPQEVLLATFLVLCLMCNGFLKGCNWEKSDICLGENLQGPRRQEQVSPYLNSVVHSVF